MGKKCPLRTVAPAVKLTEKSGKSKATESSQGRVQSWWRPSCAWEARVECGWQGKVARKFKILPWGKNNNNQYHKNLLEVLPSKYHRWGFCWVYKSHLRSKLSHRKKELRPRQRNDYRNIINITFISDIVLRMVAISTFNKGNGWCWKYIKRLWLFWRLSGSES